MRRYFIQNGYQIYLNLRVFLRMTCLDRIKFYWIWFIPLFVLMYLFLVNNISRLTDLINNNPWSFLILPPIISYTLVLSWAGTQSLIVSVLERLSDLSGLVNLLELGLVLTLNVHLFIWITVNYNNYNANHDYRIEIC